MKCIKFYGFVCLCVATAVFGYLYSRNYFLNTLLLEKNETELKATSVSRTKSEMCSLQQKLSNSIFNSFSLGTIAVDSKHCNHSNQYMLHSKESEALYELSKLLFDTEEVFSPAFLSNVSHKCKKHSQLFVSSLKNLDPWAFQMLDSSARLPSGLLNGNVNQFGDFDQCLEVQEPSRGIRGQYCLASLQMEVPEDLELLKTFQKLAESHNAFRSTFDDPGHRIPRFSSINWALCIPSSCSAADLERSLKHFIARKIDWKISFVNIRITKEMCKRRHSETNLDQGTVAAMLFFALVITICWMSTIYDCKTAKKFQNGWLAAFSLKKNIHELFHIHKHNDELQVVHGIRFFNAIMLLFAHKSMAVFFNPYINRTRLSEALSARWTVIGRAASLYTDPFLMLSGMLISYSITGRLQKQVTINYKIELLSRILRILPGMMALILFCTFILPQIGSGPQWNLVVRHHSKLCKKFWWRNALFIHNLMGFNNMCLTHTHHIALDTQLFLIAPVITLMLWKNPLHTVLAILFSMLSTTALRFYTTVKYGLSNYIYFGATTQQLLKTADYMYTSPLHRSTVYSLGLLFGYALRIYKRQKFEASQLRIGWSISLGFCIGTFALASYMNHIKYSYDSVHAGFFASVAPLSWCLIFLWIILTSHNGHKNAIITLLSWKGFQITTKLAYGFYLTQFPIFFYNVGRRRSAEFYNFVDVMFNTNEFICVIIASILLTLLFEAPFRNIKEILLKRPH